MNLFLHQLRQNRIFTSLLITMTSFVMVDGTNFVNAYQVNEQKEERLREISEILGIPVETLRPDDDTPFDSIKNLFKGRKPVKEAAIERVRQLLEMHRQQLAANPYRGEVELVKREHAIDRIAGAVQELVELAEPGGKELSEASQRALLRNLHYATQARLELPPLPEGFPAKARSKLGKMQAKLDRLFDSLRPIVRKPSPEEALGTLAQDVDELRSLIFGEAHRPSLRARFANRPLPLRRLEKRAPTVELSGLETDEPLLPSPVPAPSTPPQPIAKEGIATEIAELAEKLGRSPARIFTWVHDHVDFDPQFGAVKGPLGTWLERRGTAWDQAWLLHDLLVAAGVDARFEWGEIEMSPEILTNLTGLDDPFRAGDLLSTAGVPVVLVTRGSRVVVARLPHVWIKTFIDYVPNRGLTAGPGDTWVRMDPSIKRFTYEPGVAVHQNVPFTLGGYLESGTPNSPRRLYEEALAAYNHDTMLWVGLHEIKKERRIVAESFPFVPGTLRTKVVRVDGEAATVPRSFQHRVRIEARTPSGTSLLSWESPTPDFYGERVELTYVGATPDDQALIDQHGGIFHTPPFLVDLKPQVRTAGSLAADGGAVGSAEDMEIWVTLLPVEGAETTLVHETLAGERHVLALDLGHLPTEIVARHEERLSEARAGSDEAEVEAETLYLLGASYLENLGRDLDDLAAWKWHRLLQLGTEGLISQSGRVTTTVGGDPLTFIEAERTVDIARMTLGLFPCDGDPTFTRDTLELLGAQSSFLEGRVFAQVLTQEGVASVSALTRSQREGKTVTRVDGSNAEAVLGDVDLDAAVEEGVRQAVARGLVAWVAEAPVTVNRWTGTGYVLEDPATGAAAYLISGELAGGTETGTKLAIKERLGSEAWLENGPLGQILRGAFKALWGSPAGGPSGGPASNQGDPVNLATGNLWWTEADLTIQAPGLPIVWSRTYNSRSTYNGPLGFGWTFSFGEHLVDHPDGSVTFRQADGTEHVFLPGAAGLIAPPGTHLRLVRGVDGFTLRSKEGLVKTFDLSGRMRSIADAHQNTVALNYDASGDLSTIVDALNREVLSVSFEEGKLVRVTDLAGRSVSYLHAGDDLVAVTDAAGGDWTFSYDSLHNLIERRDPLGEATTYAHDSQDRCYRQVDPLGFAETYAYSDPGSSAIRTDRRGFDSYFEFDSEGRAITEVDPLGNISRSAWDEDHNRISTTDPLGATTLRAFDDAGNLVTETDALGQIRTFSYDPDFNQVIGATDDTGTEISQSLDTRGNVIARSQTLNGMTVSERFTYDSSGRLTGYVDRNAHGTSFSYDPSTGAVATRTDSLGNTTVFTTDDLGRLESVTDAGGGVRSLTWDRRDQVLSVSDPFGNVTSVTYDAAGRQVSVTAPQGTALLDYDALGRLVSSIDPLGGEKRFEYDENGNVVGEIDSRGNRTTTIYDALNRPLTIVDRLGNFWTYSYLHDLGTTGCSSCNGGGASGQASRIVDPLGNVRTRHFDVLGRVTSETDPLGQVTEWSYDSRGRRLRATDSLGRSTRFEYGFQNHLTAVAEANGARTESTYDPEGHRIGLRDAEGRIWSRSFNALNKLAAESDPLGNTTQLLYNDVQDLVRVVKPDGQEIRYEYDQRRLIAVELPDGSRETFAYDLLGRRVAMSNSEVSLNYSYDALHRVTEVRNLDLGETLRYEYDGNGNLIEFDGPSGPVSYRYDAMDRLVEASDPVTGTYRLDYDAIGRRLRLRYPNGTETSYVYDGSSRLAHLITRDSRGEVIDGYRYTYDAVGNRTSSVSLREGVENRYEYDDVGRLTSWSFGDDRFERYSYDLVGNRIAARNERGSAAMTFDDANRLLSEVTTSFQGETAVTSYTWSINGNLMSKDTGLAVTSYTWDALDRLIAVEEPSGLVQYGYDPTSIRVRETRNGTTRRFLHDSEDVVGVYGESGLELYVSHGPGYDEPLAQFDRNGVRYLHRDGLGSVTATTESGGRLSGTRRFSAFGGVELATGEGSRFAFTGRELDDTGLLYYRTRYYDPDVGRYLSADGFPGAPQSPQSLHRYVYVLNNPVNNVDPTGEVAQVALAAVSIVAFVGGFLLGRSLARSIQLPDVAVGAAIQTGQRTRDHLLGWLALGFFISVVSLLFLFQGPFLNMTDVWLNWVAPGLCAGTAVLFEFIEGIGFSVLDTWADMLSGLIGCLIATFLVKFFVGLIFFSATLVVVSLLTGLAVGWGTGILERRHVPLS